MPSTNSLVQFKAGLYDNYTAIQTKDINTIYFCTDTQQMFVGETEYTRPIQTGTSLPTGYQPPYSLFFKTDSKELYFSDGTKWTICSNLSTYTHPDSSVTAGSYGDTSNQTPVHGGTFKVPSFTVDAKGHLTVAADHTVKLPTETQLSKGKNTTKEGGTVGHEGTFQAVTGFIVSGHEITAEVTTYTLPTLPPDNDTTYTFATEFSDDDPIGNIKITDSNGTAHHGAVKGLAAAAYKDVTTSIDESTKLPTSAAVKSAINAAISGVTQFDVQVVTKLPTTGTKGVIYLVAHAHGTGDGYDEYIWNTAASTPAFEKIGNTDIDLSQYMKTADAQTAFAAASHTHSEYVNQNAFSNVKVGSTTVVANTTTDTLTLVAGNNVTITPDATNDKITISSTDTALKWGSF